MHCSWKSSKGYKKGIDYGMKLVVDKNICVNIFLSTIKSGSIFGTFMDLFVSLKVSIKLFYVISVLILYPVMLVYVCTQRV